MEWDGGRRRICRLQGPAVPADHGRALALVFKSFPRAWSCITTTAILSMAQWVRDLVQARCRPSRDCLAPRLQSAARKGKEVENPMMSEIAQLLDLDRANELSSLQPVSEIVAVRIATRYPSISKQYLEFIRAVGVGSTTRDFYIYEPEPASSVEQHPSFQLYQSASYRALSGPRPEGHPIYPRRCGRYCGQRCLLEVLPLPLSRRGGLLSRHGWSHIRAGG